MYSIVSYSILYVSSWNREFVEGEGGILSWGKRARGKETVLGKAGFGAKGENKEPSPTVRASRKEKRDISISQNFFVWDACLTKVLYQRIISFAKRLLFQEP